MFLINIMHIYEASRVPKGANNLLYKISVAYFAHSSSSKNELFNLMWYLCGAENNLAKFASRAKLAKSIHKCKMISFIIYFWTINMRFTYFVLYVHVWIVLMVWMKGKKCDAYGNTLGYVKDQESEHKMQNGKMYSVI